MRSTLGRALTASTTTHKSGRYEEGQRDTRPPQPGSAEHWAAWLDRYGDHYATDGERRTAVYQDFMTNLAALQTTFGPQPAAGEGWS